MSGRPPNERPGARTNGSRRVEPAGAIGRTRKPETCEFAHMGAVATGLWCGKSWTGV